MGERGDGTAGGSGADSSSGDDAMGTTPREAIEGDVREENRLGSTPVMGEVGGVGWGVDAVIVPTHIIV